MAQKKILVVDDNTVNLATIQKGLGGRYEIVPMISGKRAIRYLYTNRVDLILLDVEMPEMNGVETLEEIRKLESAANVPVIFLTAKKDKATVVEGFRLGIMDYITKPFEVEDVEERIDYVFKRCGVLPFSKEEMYRVLEKMLKHLENNNLSQFVNALNEALRYDTDEEIIGRIRNAKSKLDASDLEGAVAVIRRTHKMIEVEIGGGAKVSQKLTREQIKENIAVILEDIDNFKTKEALEKCRNLQRSDLPKFIEDLISNCIVYLNNYDDEQAEKLLRKLLDM